MAGINAALNALDKEEMILSRSDAYIGVLIDDLSDEREQMNLIVYSLQGLNIVYFFAMIMQILRLTEIGHEIGLISEERYERFKAKKQAKLKMK